MTRLALALVCLAASASACSGEINEPEGDHPNNPVPPIVDPDEPLVPSFRLEPDAPTTQPGIRRLTKSELVRTIRHATGVTADVSGLPTDDELLHLGNDASRLNVSDGTHMRELLVIATDVAASVDIDAVLPCAGACTDDELRSYLERAFSEPLDAETMTTFRDIYAQAQSELDGDLARRAIVQQSVFSPKLLYRTEIGVDGVLTPSELAKKLSYFLWGRPPDDTLRGHAFDGSIADETVFASEVDRMLAHDNTRERIIEIVFDYLGMDHFDLSTKDAAADLPVDMLQASMIEEAERMIGRVLFEEASGFRELLTTETTEVDELLAMHYGIEGVTGSEFQEVSLEGTSRRGLLTTALALSSHSKESGRSPMQRGSFLVDQILCLSFPPDAGEASMTLPDGVEDKTFREQFAPLETTAPCSNCHRMLNAGFAFALFDNVGRRYPLDRVGDEEAVGTLDIVPYDAVEFSSPGEAVEGFSNHPVFTRCVVGQVYRYGQGSVPADVDADILANLEDSFDGSDGNMLELLRSIALSERFEEAVQ